VVRCQDRIIFYRLEHICYCVETGRWRMSHRSHQSDYCLPSTPNMSVPGTPGSGSQDYAIEEVCDVFQFSAASALHNYYSTLCVQILLLVVVLRVYYNQHIVLPRHVAM